MTDYIKYIEEVRAQNNVLWMDILRLAMMKAPEETKRILKNIRENDMMISTATGLIANDED